MQSKGKATPKQIAEWKEKYGTVHEFEIDGKVIYLKKFDRKSVSLALGFLGKDFLQFGEALVENNYLGGVDKIEVIEDTEIMIPLCDALSDIVSGQKAKYVKH